MKVLIIDYGMGNIRSVSNALKSLGAKTKIVDTPRNMNGQKTIIPGVGAFGDAMKNLGPFSPKIRETLETDTSLLGICVGMQTLFENSDESPEVEGIGVLEGHVTRIKTGFKLPHIGWNSLKIEKKDCPLFKDIEDGYVYYAHTYHVKPRKDITAATSEYGTQITAAVFRGMKAYDSTMIS